MGIVWFVPHPAEHAAAERALGRDEAESLAEAMRAFGSATRLRLLWALIDGERTVEQLTIAVAMEQSAVSHQLRMLAPAAPRILLCAGDGRRAFYRRARPPPPRAARGDAPSPRARHRTAARRPCPPSLRD